MLLKCTDWIVDQQFLHVNWFVSNQTACSYPGSCYLKSANLHCLLLIRPLVHRWSETALRLSEELKKHKKAIREPLPSAEICICTSFFLLICSTRHLKIHLLRVPLEKLSIASSILSFSSAFFFISCFCSSVRDTRHQTQVFLMLLPHKQHSHGDKFNYFSVQEEKHVTVNSKVFISRWRAKQSRSSPLISVAVLLELGAKLIMFCKVLISLVRAITLKTEINR